MAYNFKNAKILVVDDMQPMLTLVGSLLKIFGFTNVTFARDGEEGYRKFCDVNPDIVLTDWLMEPVDGLELVRRIRNNPDSPNRFVPIIMMTGYSHKIRVIKSRDNGVTEFLVKPFRAKDLYARIEKLIEKPRQFVMAEEFFGPDRRRRKPQDFMGPFRREEDVAETEEAPQADDKVTGLLKDLHTQIEMRTRNIKSEE